MSARLLIWRTQLVAIFLLFTITQLTTGQPAESFFPHHTGDRWDYAYWNGGFYTFYSLVLTRDSVGTDGSHNLFYNNSFDPKYRIDSSDNVFWRLTPNCNNLLYKLRADSGDVWENSVCGERWAWVARVDSGTVFFQPTVIKTFQYGPVHPDSGPQPYVLVERWLASGFGLIYEWMEPGVFSSLTGCVIAGDTFGIITSVRTTKEFELPHDYHLEQNYPNPFNPTTTIEFALPQAAVVSLRISDLVGRHVATLSHGKLAAGRHRVLWDAGRMSSGVYFCRLRADGNIRTIKMILAK